VKEVGLSHDDASIDSSVFCPLCPLPCVPGRRGRPRCLNRRSPQQNNVDVICVRMRSAGAEDVYAASILHCDAS
jgi:hypothetical protein